MTFWQDIFFAFWFFLPAGLANMSASLAGNISVMRDWSYPMDFNFNFRGKRIFGANKTLRGLLIGIVVAVLVVFLQKILYSHWSFLNTSSSIDYKILNPAILGLLLGAGALLGDAVESFFKRQMEISPGQAFLFFDQIDYIIGGLVLSALYVRLAWTEYFLVIAAYFILHIAVNYFGFTLGLRKQAI